MQRAALIYAGNCKWPVLPLKGKLPILQHGARDATLHLPTIKSWWRVVPDANVAITLPQLLVADVDPRNGGDASWDALISQYGEPETLTQRTGSGGLHYVFERPDFAVNCKPWPGIDVVAGAHRYIVAAPSVHPSTGLRYQWLKWRKPAVLPGWLASAIRRQTPANVPRPQSSETDAASALARALAYVEKCPPAVAGCRGHTTTFTTALKLCTNFPQLSQSELCDVLCEYNQTCDPPWNSRDLRHKLDDAMKVRSWMMIPQLRLGAPVSWPDTTLTIIRSSTLTSSAPQFRVSRLRPRRKTGMAMVLTKAVSGVGSSTRSARFWSRKSKPMKRHRVISSASGT